MTEKGYFPDRSLLAFNKRETIAHDDPTSYSTKVGFERWEKYRQEQLAKMTRESGNAGCNFSRCRALWPDFEIERTEGLDFVTFNATWTKEKYERINGRWEAIKIPYQLAHTIRKGEDESDGRRTLIKECLKAVVGSPNGDRRSTG